MEKNKSNKPLRIWFIGLICFALLSTYLPIAIPSIIPLLVIIFGLVLATQIQKLEISTWLKCIYYVLIIASVVLSQREYLFIIIAALILQFVFNFEDTFSLSCILVSPLIIITEILAYWGLPFTSWLVWYWGLPFLLLSFTIVLLCKRNHKLPMMLTLAVGILLISHTAILYHYRDINIKLVTAESSSNIEGVTYNLSKNLSDLSTLINQSDAIKEIKEGKDDSNYLIILPSTPVINDSFLKVTAKKGKFWLFAEHDNLGEFIGSGSIFNNDSFARTGPWHAFRPVMTRNLKNASDIDPLYASNIGCTIKNKALLYPLIWEYTPYGIPVLLAAGETKLYKRFTYIGDSDPIVKFLVPYNTHFLQALFGKPDILDFFKGVLLILCVLISLNIFMKSFRSKILIGLFTLCLIVAAALPSVIASMPSSPVDVSMRIIGNFISPHIDSHYSSLPKFISQKDVTVAINQPDRQAKLYLLIVGGGRYKLKDSRSVHGKKIVMMTPSSSLKIDNNLYTVNDVPLGKKEMKIFGATVLIPDAREIYVNGKKSNSTIMLSDQIIVIGTNSPQLVKDIDSIITK